MLGVRIQLLSECRMNCAPVLGGELSRQYNIFLFVVGFILPLALILTSSASMLRSMKTVGLLINQLLIV